MSSSSPDITELKVAKNEQELIHALYYQDDPDIPGKAVEALASIGTIPSLEPLCRLMEDSDQSTEFRIKTAAAIGDICARSLKVQEQINPDSLSGDELSSYQEKDRMLSWAGSCLKLSMKTGPAALRRAAGSAYLILPLEDDSDTMKAFSNSTTVSFQSSPAATIAFAQNPEDQSIAPQPVEHSDDITEESEPESEPDSEPKPEPDSEPEPEPESEPDSEPEEKIVVQADPQIEAEDTETDELKLDELVEIAPNTYWIGTRKGDLLEQNIYLRIFSDGSKTINLLIDPGPPEDLPTLARVLSSKIGGLKNINVMFLNHQDPDVAHNASHLQELNPDCFVLCSEDSWRLVKSYGLNPEKYKAIEQFKDLTVEMSTGHYLRFVPSPYCHFRGSVMLYDEETGVLFTGDFLGGLSNGPSLYATEDSWNGISTFHQIYMPTREAIRNAVINIRKLDPLPKIVAPQHGSIISGDLVNDFLSKIDILEVGIDLFLKEHSKASYIEAMNELLSEFGKIAGPAIKSEVLSAFLSDSSFPNVISLGANSILDIKVDPYFAVEVLLHEMKSKTSPEIWKTAEISVFNVLTMRKISIPDSILQKASDQMVFILGDRFKS